MLSASTITTHTRATLTTHHTHLHCTIITYTPEYSNSRLHTYLYISYYVTPIHRSKWRRSTKGRPKGPLPRPQDSQVLAEGVAKDLNACVLCVCVCACVRVCVCVVCCVIVCIG